jgi:hypothetical protein
MVADTVRLDYGVPACGSGPVIKAPVRRVGALNCPVAYNPVFNGGLSCIGGPVMGAPPPVYGPAPGVPPVPYAPPAKAPQTGLNALEENR